MVAIFNSFSLHRIAYRKSRQQFTITINEIKHVFKNIKKRILPFSYRKYFRTADWATILKGPANADSRSRGPERKTYLEWRMDEN